MKLLIFGISGHTVEKVRVNVEGWGMVGGGIFPTLWVESCLVTMSFTWLATWTQQLTLLSVMRNKILCQAQLPRRHNAMPWWRRIQTIMGFWWTVSRNSTVLLLSHSSVCRRQTCPQLAHMRISTTLAYFSVGIWCIKWHFIFFRKIKHIKFCVLGLWWFPHSPSLLI